MVDQDMVHSHEGFWHPMKDVEDAHKISFKGTTIIPKPGEEWEDDKNGILSFDGYAIVPRERFLALEIIEKAVARMNANNRAAKEALDAELYAIYQDGVEEAIKDEKS